MGRNLRRKKRNGTGCLYKRGNVYWLKYHQNGKPHYENSHTDNVEEAQRRLNKRLGEIAEGKPPGMYFDKVTFKELAEDFLTDYRINGRDTLSKAERSVKYLQKTFGRMKAVDVSTSKVKTYIDGRQQKGASNASINRELAALKRMFRLGARCTPPKVNVVPYIPMLKESNVRKGFFEANEYEALKGAFPKYLKPVVTFGYHSGWRKSEILGLTWDRVDLHEGIARLDPGQTKNEEGRTLYFNQELMQEMKTLFGKRELGSPYVFHRKGKPIKGFRKAWINACLCTGSVNLSGTRKESPLWSKARRGK